MILQSSPGSNQDPSEDHGKTRLTKLLKGPGPRGAGAFQ